VTSPTSPPPSPKVILITDPAYALDKTARVIEKAAAALGAGALMVQLRDKTSPKLQVASLARKMRQITANCGALFTINIIRVGEDLLDIAKEVRADGVHAPCERQRVGTARAAMKWASVPTHTDAEVWTANTLAADAMLVSPIFLVPGKGVPRGMGALAVARKSKKRVYALGGITPERAQMCADAGAHGVAVIRALLSASDPAAVALDLAKPFS
jgi:thiamine-phosphate pyrophosphorylase